jgi:hypothetical protein
MIAVSKVWRRSFGTLRLTSPGTGLQRSLVAASPCILPSFAALATSGPAKLVCLSIQHRVQRLLHRSTNHLAEMVSYPGFIDLDDLTHRLLRPYLERTCGYQPEPNL